MSNYNCVLELGHRNILFEFIAITC